MSAVCRWVWSAVVAVVFTGCGVIASPPDAGEKTNDAGVTDASSPDPKPSPAPFAFPKLQDSLPEFELIIDPTVFSEIIATENLQSRDERPAVFVADGVRHDVIVRLRGSSSRSFPKKSWRVEFVDEKYDGRKKHNFVAEYQDSTLMAEKLGFDLLLAMGAAAPRTRYVRFTINGVYQGVYLDIERVDKNFLSAHPFDDRDGSIYRCGNKDCEMKLWRTPYQKAFEKKTNEALPYDDLDAFLLMVNRTQEPQFESALSEQLELESYLRSMAMEALVSNGIQTDSGSYLVHDRVTNRWTYVPWDVNNADSTFWYKYPPHQEPFPTRPVPGYSLFDEWIAKLYAKRLGTVADYLPAFSNLNTRIAFNPRLRARFADTLERALDELYATGDVSQRIDAMYALIEPPMRTDPHVDLVNFREGPRYLKAFHERREVFLRQEIAALRARPLELVLETVDPNGGFIELRNRSDLPVKLDGLVVTTNLRRALVGNLPQRTLQPGEVARFTGAELGIVIDPKGGELGLFDGVSVAGAIDVLFYGPLKVGERLVRKPEAPDDWMVAKP